MTQLFPMIYDAYVRVAFAWHTMTPVIFNFKLNQLINQLEYIVDRFMVPLNRVFPSATTFAFMGRLLFGPLSCLWSVPPTREGYGRAVPWPGKQT